MASQVEKAEWVLRFHESRSAVTVQRRFRTTFGREPPTKISVYKWEKLFDQTGCIFKGKSPRIRPVAEAQVDTVCAAFVCSPRKSTKHAARQLNMPHTTMHKNLRKHLKFKSYKYELLQHVTTWDKDVRSDFLSRLQDDELFTAKIVFSGEGTFHLSGNVNQHDQNLEEKQSSWSHLKWKTVQSYDICRVTHGDLIGLV
jgi:hypothetical protein